MDNLHIVNLASYNRPKISEDKNRDWVEYGEDNDYYSYLIDLYTNSTTNNAIINNMSRLIYGRGIGALNASKKPNEYAAMVGLFTPSVLRGIAQGLKLLGDVYIQCIYNKAHTKIEKVDFLTANYLRPEK